MKLYEVLELGDAAKRALDLLERAVEALESIAESQHRSRPSDSR